MKRGRPKKKAAERKARVVCHRVTETQYSELFYAAKKAGLSISEYAKKKLFGG